MFASMNFPLETLISYISRLDDKGRASLCNLYHLINKAWECGRGIVGDTQTMWIIFVDENQKPVKTLPPIPPGIRPRNMDDRVRSALEGFLIFNKVSTPPKTRLDFLNLFYLHLNEELKSKGITPLSLQKLAPV